MESQDSVMFVHSHKSASHGVRIDTETGDIVLDKPVEVDEEDENENEDEEEEYDDDFSKGMDKMLDDVDEDAIVLDNTYAMGG